MNFSIINGECPFGQGLNHKKALYSAFLAEQSGIQAIPHIYAINKFHRALWTRYLIKNPQIGIIAMNCQLQKNAKDREVVINSVLNLIQSVPQELHVVLLGFPFHLIHRFGVFLDRIHFADKVPVKCAQSRKKLFIDPTTLRMGNRSVDEPIDLLFTHNINQRRLYIEMIKQKILENYKLPQEIKTLLLQNNFWIKDKTQN
jgi:hypothetical protein